VRRNTSSVCNEVGISPHHQAGKRTLLDGLLELFALTSADYT